MIGGIVVMLIMTFGLSRLVLYLLPSTIDERAKAIWANLGALFVIGAIYAAITVSESDGPALIVLGLAFAAPCQALWYWRDLPKVTPYNAGPRVISATRSSAPALRLAAAPRPREKPSEATVLNADRQETWHALVRYDAEVVAAADQLRPFGEKWVEELGRSYFALNEDKRYLPNIIARLLEDAAAERAANFGADLRRAMNGRLSASSLEILREAQNAGYRLEVEGRTIALCHQNTMRSFLYDEEDVQSFGRSLRARLDDGSASEHQ
jgi:hypothetical protein